jgi:hypothetical protein
MAGIRLFSTLASIYSSFTKQTDRGSRIQKILFDAELIELARELGFPEFS